MAETSCGSCSLCCRLLGVPALNKPAGKWCDHCDKSKGCSIYADRPQSCIAFECLWLQSAKRGGDVALPLAMRPDKSHVVFSALVKPDGSTTGLVAYVNPGYPQAWREGMAGRLIEHYVKRGQQVAIIIGAKRILFNLDPSQLRDAAPKDEASLHSTSPGAKVLQLSEGRK